MKKIVLSLFAATVFMIAASLFGGHAGAASLPEVVYLGEGPGTFTTPLDNFVVKVVPFDFDWQPGPTFETAPKQRVWGVRGTNEKPPRLWLEEVNLGEVKAGCVSKYIGIDDDLDGRRNFFLLDGDEIEAVSEGMVFSGSFVIPRDGNLTFIANDSVAGWFEKCSEQEDPTVTPTDAPTNTPTNTPTAIATGTIGPSPTATNTPLPTETSMPWSSPTATTTTATEIATVQLTLESTATATKRPRELACLRINFDVGGQSAKRGLYVVQEVGGHVLVEWYAEDGWTDSGWFKDIDITFEAVYVQVLYYSGPEAAPIKMKILNPAPGSPYGWVSRGTCHALEVAWPDEDPDGNNTEVIPFQLGEVQPSLDQQPQEEPAREAESGNTYASLSSR